MYDIDHNFNSTSDSKISISREEIQHHIKSLSNEKASCPVFFTNEPFIFCGDKIVDELCIFSIRYLDMHMFKVGTCKVLSVFKGKDKSYPTHYRGITITSALSKSFERVILFYIENDFSHIHYNLV